MARQRRRNGTKPLLALLLAVACFAAGARAQTPDVDKAPAATAPDATAGAAPAPAAGLPAARRMLGEKAADSANIVIGGGGGGMRPAPYYDPYWPYPQPYPYPQPFPYPVPPTPYIPGGRGGGAIIIGSSAPKAGRRLMGADAAQASDAADSANIVINGGGVRPAPYYDPYWPNAYPRPYYPQPWPYPVPPRPYVPGNRGGAIIIGSSAPKS